MKRIKALLIILLALALFSCKSTDFKRIHKEVVEIDEPETASVSSASGEEENVVAKEAEPVEDEGLMPLYENGGVVSREDEDTYFTGGGAETESVDAESAASFVPGAEERVQKEDSDDLPYMKIILPSAALIVILLIVLISIRASRVRKHKSGERGETEEEFSYSFDDGEYEVYMGTLDRDDECGEDDAEDDDVDDEPFSDSAEEIISILKGM